MVRRKLYMGNDKKIAHRDKSKGVRYELTPELKSHLALMRKEINLTAEQMAEELNLNVNTYANIEKRKGSTTITSEMLERFFEKYQEHLAEWKGMEKERFIIMHLDKCLYTPGKIRENLDNQDWLKALYMKYQTVPINETILERLTEFQDLEKTILLLNENLQIKLKTKIRYTNEVYINVKENENEKEKYPDYGGNPFWCIRYDIGEKELEKIIPDIENKQEIRYSLLFSLLVSAEVKKGYIRDYNSIYAKVYGELKDIYGYENIFDKISRIEQSKSDIQNGTFTPTRTPVKSTDFNIGNIPPHIEKLVFNCLNGKDNFINSINVDFSPLYKATSSEIEQFKTELQQLINNYDKKRTD